MKRIISFGSLFLLFACRPAADTTRKPVYEILSQQDDGGARIPFFELLTEANEIKMLQNDPNLHKKIKAADLSQCNFVILNVGEKEILGYQYAIEEAKETKDSILIQTKLLAPTTNQKPEQDIYYTPFTVLKINSKKPIRIN